MKAYLYYVSAGLRTDSHDVVVLREQDNLDDFLHAVAIDHAESYGVEWNEDYGHYSKYSDPEIEIEPEGYVEFEIVTLSDLEEADMYRAGGGSFKKELEDQGFVFKG